MIDSKIDAKEGSAQSLELGIGYEKESGHVPDVGEDKGAFRDKHPLVGIVLHQSVG